MAKDKVEFAEFFFADSAVAPGKDGLIWKSMLTEGVWNIGPNGRPLKVIKGRSKNQRVAVGMQDIVDAFNDNAVPHVTVPLSHDDKVDENTGYVKKMKIAKDANGVHTLYGGHDFTDTAIKQKVLDRSIANTSMGLEFDYTRKDDGKKYGIIARHNALTNRPWLGRKLAPFGLEESDDVEYQIEVAQFSEALDEADREVDFTEEDVDPWEGSLSLEDIKKKIQDETKLPVTQIAHDRVMLKDGDKSFVAIFDVENGVVTLAERANWVERTQAVKPDTVTSIPTAILSEDVQPPKQQEPTMGTEETPSAPSGAPAQQPPVAPVLKFEDSDEYKAMKEQIDLQKAQNDQLLAESRTNRANAFVDELKDLGFSEKKGHTGFLKKARAIALSDTGEAAILLSEDGVDTPRPIGAYALVRELLSELKDDKGKLTIQFSEQVTDPLNQHQGQKPPAEANNEEHPDPTAKLSDEEKQKQWDMWLAEHAGVPAPEAAKQ